MKNMNICHCEKNAAKRNLAKQSVDLSLLQEVMRLLLRLPANRNDKFLFAMCGVINHERTIKSANSVDTILANSEARR